MPPAQHYLNGAKPEAMLLGFFFFFLKTDSVGNIVALHPLPSSVW